MKNTKSNSIMTKFITLVTIIGLALSFGSTAMAETDNVVGSAPLVLIGGSGSAGTISITEAGAGALSETAPNDTIVIDLPTGVTFGAAPVANVTDGDLTLTIDAGFAIGDSSVLWNIDTESTSASTIVIQIPEIDVAASVSPGDITANINSGIQSNPGLTEGDLVIAKATEGKAVATIDSAVNVPIDSTGNAITDIEIFESTQGSLELGDTVELQLPSGVIFDGVPAIAGEMGSSIGFDAGVVTDGLVTFEVNAVSTVPATVTISGISIDVDDTVAVGDIDAELTSGDALDQTLTIATAAKSGLQAIVVDASETDPATDPAELDADDVPVSPAGRLDVQTAAILVTENFPTDLTDDDSLTLTLPAGVTFFSNYDVRVNGDGAPFAAPTANPTGFGTSTFEITAGTTDEDMILGGGSTLSVIIDDSVPVGPVVATLTGTVDEVAITPIELTILEVVATGVTVEENETIPSVGLGSDSSAFGEFTITESNFGALLANNSTITIDLPEGITFDGLPTATVGTGNVALSTASVDTDEDKATFKVTTASTTASVITIAGDIAIDSGFAIGPIVATIGGTAGAIGTVEIAQAANGVVATVTSTPTLVPGQPTQDISNIVLTEAFAGALGTGSFRLLTNVGTWSTNDPEVDADNAGVPTTVGGDTFDGTGQNAVGEWDFELSESFESNDTLVVNLPFDTASTEAAMVTLSLLRLNVPAGTPEGAVNITLIDGNEDGDNKAGIVGGTLLAGFIGERAEVVATPNTVEVSAGTTAEVTVEGGIGDYVVASDDEDIATATVDGNTITITALTVGEVELTVQDGTVPATDENTDTITVTVTPVADLVLDSGNPEAPDAVSLPEGGTADVMIVGGFGPFTAESADEDKATVVVDGNTLTVTGVAAGEETVEITVTDSNPDTPDTATLTVTVTTPEALVVAPEVLNVNFKADEVSTGDFTITGGVGPFTATSSDVAVATVAVVGNTVTVTGLSKGPVTVTITDSEGTEVTATANIVEVIVISDEPGENVTVTTFEEIEELFVQFGDVATTEDGTKLEISTKFPAFEGEVDIWVAFIVFDMGHIYLFNEEGNLVLKDLNDPDVDLENIPAYRVGTTGPIDEVLFPEMDTCTPFGPTVPVGNWGVTYIIAPTNGGVFDLEEGVDPFLQSTYLFTVECE